MDQEALRRLILRKLRAGRLPRDGIRTVRSGPSDGETCDACDRVLAKTELLMEGVPLDPGMLGACGGEVWSCPARC